jgi:hypothetical protein
MEFLTEWLINFGLFAVLTMIFGIGAGYVFLSIWLAERLFVQAPFQVIFVFSLFVVFFTTAFTIVEYFGFMP